MGDADGDRSDENDLGSADEVGLNFKTCWSLRHTHKADTDAREMSMESFELSVRVREAPRHANSTQRTPKASATFSDPRAAAPMDEYSPDEIVGNKRSASNLRAGGEDGATNLAYSAIPECTVLLGFEDDTVGFTPTATAFFVGYNEEQHRFIYLITDEHAIADLVKKRYRLLLKVNLKDPYGSHFLRLDPTAFYFDPDEADSAGIAVSPLLLWPPVKNPFSELLELDVHSISVNGDSSLAMTRGEMVRHKLGVDNTIAIAGLLTARDYLRRDVPIARFGRISAIPGEPVSVRHGGPLEAYLVEVQSIGGMRGAPVFVRMPEMRRLNEALAWGGDPPERYGLLGMMHGPLDTSKLWGAADGEEPGSGPGAHTGIGVIVPIDKILEALQHPDLAAIRRETIAKDG